MSSVFYYFFLPLKETETLKPLKITRFYGCDNLRDCSSASAMGSEATPTIATFLSNIALQQHNRLPVIAKVAIMHFLSCYYCYCFVNSTPDLTGLVVCEHPA